MNNRIRIALGVLVLGATAVAAQAGGRDGRDDDYRHDGHRDGDRGYAQVLSVAPIVERVRYTEPVEQCWDEQRAVHGGSDRHVIVGTLIGAAIGRHVGEVHGDRAAGTVGGALIGAAVGGQIARDRGDYGDVRHETVRHCETRYEERWNRQVVAYRVDYVYRGRHDVARLAYDPGRWFRVDDAHRYG